MLAKGARQKSVLPAGGSSIVFISSVAALVGEPGASVYSAAKGALISLARSLAVELAAERVRVNCVIPGLVRTPMGDRLVKLLSPAEALELEKRHCLGFGDPSDIAAAVAFLLSDDARWITGTTLVVDGGYSAH
jgi:NAD(P)-dependent dehydrogenase (short-subunit alcohol dehydrogenase family)